MGREETLIPGLRLSFEYNYERWYFDRNTGKEWFFPKTQNPPGRIHETQLLFSQLCCFFNTFRSHTVDDLVDVLESFASKCTPVCWFLCFLWLFTHQKSSVILPTSQIAAREHRISSTTAWMNIQACGECFDTKWICELGRSCNKIKVRLSGSSSFISTFHPTMCALEQKIIQPL